MARARTVGCVLLVVQFSAVFLPGLTSLRRTASPLRATPEEQRMAQEMLKDTPVGQCLEYKS